MTELFIVRLEKRQPRELIRSEDHNSKVDAVHELAEVAKRVLADIIYWYIDRF